jgi:hypothetical protein
MYMAAPSPADFHAQLSAVADLGLLQEYELELELLTCPTSFAEDMHAPLEHGLSFNNNINVNVNNNIRPPGPPNWQPDYRA